VVLHGTPARRPAANLNRTPRARPYSPADDRRRVVNASGGANHGPSGPNTRADTAVSHHDSDDIAFWTSDRDEIDQEESPQ
jgi:hypothetical protein